MVSSTYLQESVEVDIDEFLTKAARKETTELDTFKVLTRNWVANALTTLNEIEKICRTCGGQDKIGDQCQLLRHYLGYLAQLCEGKVGSYTEIEPKNNPLKLEEEL